MTIRSMETNDAPWQLLTLGSKLTSNFVKATTVEVCSLYDRHGISGMSVTVFTLKTTLIFFDPYFYVKPDVSTVRSQFK